jgi:hypothetical protein
MQVSPTRAGLMNFSGLTNWMRFGSTSTAGSDRRAEARAVTTLAGEMELRIRPAGMCVTTRS